MLTTAILDPSAVANSKAIVGCFSLEAQHLGVGVGRGVLVDPQVGLDRVQHLGLDTSGKVCVTGYSYRWNTGYDYLTIKYAA